MKVAKIVLFLLLAAQLSFTRSERTFYGEISDTQSAMNVHSLSHSHQEMLKKGTFGSDAASCARTCVRRGGEWALRTKDDVYHLKNQAGVDDYAGEQVKVIGTLDPKSRTIDNVQIILQTIPTIEVK